MGSCWYCVIRDHDFDHRHIYFAMVISWRSVFSARGVLGLEATDVDGHVPVCMVAVGAFYLEVAR